MENFKVTFCSFQLLVLFASTFSMPNGSEFAFQDTQRTHSYDFDHQQDTPRGSKNKTLGFQHEDCALDGKWQGKWFQTGFDKPIYIDGKSIGPKGVCLEKTGKDKFLFYHANTNCHKCVVINERHYNILQYKESSYCEDKDTLENLCRQIPGDAPLFSLFRIDAQPIDCPFKGAPFTFTYNRGNGECREPVSNIDACLESSKLLLRYQACPNIPKTESKIEELECTAEWREGSNHYVIGKLGNHHLALNSHEDQYRCFWYEKIKHHSNTDGEGHSRTIGYRIAQSGDASCTDISSPLDGANSLVLTKVEQPTLPKCKFPNWMTHHWHTLNGKTSVRIHSKNSTLHLTTEMKRNSTLQSNILRIETPSPKFSGETRIICQRRLDVSDKHITIVAQRTVGCRTETVCLNIYKRDSHVIELRIKPKYGNDDWECGNNQIAENPSDTPVYMTLVSAMATQRRCPHFGKYIGVASPITQRRFSRQACDSNGGPNGFSTVVVGCGHKGTMEFHTKCASDEPIAAYMCHGNWEEDGRGYLIATPLSRPSNSAHRYCFMYTQTPSGLRFTRSSESCRTDDNPEVETVWAFNLTVDGQCAEPLTGSSTRTYYSKFLIFTKLLVLLSAKFL